ncbi:MAG TPA: FAD:protein FMN transferase [Acidimicrobiales bacterium]|nr:FAD:protein FMN transferase [Acidimicrobiales bacterium]
MGTIVTIDLYGDPSVANELDPALQLAVESLHDADDVFSTWKPESPLSQLRRGEIELATAPPEVREVLEACGAARELSRGWFDPWSLAGGVDPTGYVKGWAAQRALHLLLGAPVFGAVVNAAGDIATFGFPAENSSFQVGITNPSDRQELTAIVSLNGCIATSGTYERGPHLFDPHSGEFASRLASASVTGPDLGLADALATALAVAGTDFLTVIEEVTEFEAFAVTDDGERQWTSGFPLLALATVRDQGPRPPTRG